MDSDLIPINRMGKSTDLDFSVDLPSREAADLRFALAVTRLLSPVTWHTLAGWASAKFLPTDEKGKKLQGLVRKGDFLRIDIPGPGPRAGNGYDWVKVEILEDHLDPLKEEEWIGLKVRPCPEPGKMESYPAHFFKQEASSTFIIKREGMKVTAFYHGRNEVPNTSTDKTLDNVRNAVVAAGALASFSELQWESLNRGLLSPVNPNDLSPDGA